MNMINFIINLWQNYYIGKRYYLWVEVLVILLIVLGIGLSIISVIIGGFNN